MNGRKLLVIIFILLCLLVTATFFACGNAGQAPLADSGKQTDPSIEEPNKEHTEEPTEEEPQIPSSSVVFPSLSGLRFVQRSYVADNGGTLVFSVEDNYLTKQPFTISANGAELIPIDGVYTLKNASAVTLVEFAGAYSDSYTYVGKNLPNGVSIEQGEVEYGGTASFSVELLEKYRNSDFTVSVNGVQVYGENGVYYIKNVTDNLQIEVNGVSLNVYSAQYAPGENGSVTGELVQAVEYGGSTSAVTAVPAEHYVFLKWSDGLTDAVRRDVITADMQAVAMFVPITFSVTLSNPSVFELYTVDEGVVTQEKSSAVALLYGSDYSFSVVPSEEYSQSSYTISVGDKTINPTEGIYTVKNITQDFTIGISGLTLNTYQVDFVGVDGVIFGGYAVGSDTGLAHGSDFSFTVSTESGYNQSELQVVANGVPLECADGVYTVKSIKCSQSVTVLSANKNSYVVSFDADGGFEVISEYYNHGDLLRTLPTTSKNDSMFIGWKLLPYNTLFDEAVTHTVTSDMSFVALYEQATPFTYYQNTAIVGGARNGRVVVPDMHANLKILTLSLNYQGQEDITEIVMGDNVTEVTDGGSLTKLQSIRFSKNINKVGWHAFNGCRNLEKVIIESKSVHIGVMAFLNCTSLKQVEIGGINGVEDYAFSGCVALDEFDVASFDGDIGASAFEFTPITSFTFGANTEKIGQYAFRGSGLQTLVLPMSLAKLGEGAFSESSIQSITFGKEACIVEKGAFQNCQLSENVVVPENYTLAEEVFSGDSVLKTAVVPTLTAGLFSNCGALTEVTVTNPISSFPNRVFSNCLSFVKVNYPQNSRVETIGERAFEFSGRNSGAFSLYVYGNALDTIGEYAFYQSEIQQLNIKTENELTLKQHCFDTAIRLSYFELPSTTVEIGEEAFCGLSEYLPKDLRLPSSLRIIGKKAFWGMMLKKVVLPSSIESIGDEAFADMYDKNEEGYFSDNNAQVIFQGATVPNLGENVFSVLVDNRYEGYEVGGTVTVKVPSQSLESYKENEKFIPYTVVASAVSDLRYNAEFYSGYGLGKGELISTLSFCEGEYITAPQGVVRTHYDLLGWSETGTAPLFDFTAEQTTGKVLIAVWGETQYPVEYELNGGDNALSNPVYYTVTLGAEFAAASRTGYVFEGWFTSPDFTGETVSSVSVGEGGYIKLYAKFTIMLFDITFVTDGVSAPNAQRISYGACAVMPKAPQRTGFEFEGWYIDQEAYSFDTHVTKDIVLRAKWNTQSYTLTLNGCGGTFSGEAQKEYATEYASPLVLDYLPQRVGYRFVAWQYKDGSAVPLSACMPASDLSIDAQWEAHVYSVIYDEQGGLDVEDKSVTYASSIGELPVTKKLGYTFGGWKLGERYVVSGETFLQTSSVTLTAEWKENSYILRFIPYGGEGEMPDQIFMYTERKAISHNAFTQKGAYFSHWTPSFPWREDFSDGQVLEKLTAEDGTVILLYAQWINISYTIAFNGAGAEGSMDSVSAAYGYSKVLPLCAFTKANYSFDGWSYGGKTYRNGQSVSSLTEENGATVTFTAIWKGDIKNVRFQSVGGSAVATQSVAYGSQITLAQTEKTGYDFDGWYNGAEGGEQVSSPYTVTENILLYAHWLPRTCTLTFYCQEQECPTDDGSQRHVHSIKTAAYNSVLVDFPLPPTLSGQTFEYWKDQNNGVFKADSIVREDLFLTAVWTPALVTISQSDTDGTFELITGSGSATVTAANVPVKNDCVFEGYFTSSAYITAVELPFTTQQNTTLYAKYVSATDNLVYENYGRGYFAKLRADTTAVVVPDLHNGFEVYAFDADNKRFSSALFGASVNSAEGLSGFAGESFFCDDKMLLDTYGLNRAVNLKEIAERVSPLRKGSGAQRMISEGVIYGNTDFGSIPTSVKVFPIKKNASNYVLPDSVTVIEAYAFYGVNLSSIREEGLIRIDEYAFCNCADIAFDFSAYTGAPMSKNVFEGCNINTLEINTQARPNGVSGLFTDGLPTAVKKVTFVGSGELTSVITGAAENVSEVELSGYTAIGARAFAGYTRLEKINTDGLTAIGYDAFASLCFLADCVLPEGLVTIGSGAFANTSSLAYSPLPSTVTAVGAAAFAGSKWTEGLTVFDTDALSAESQAFVGAPLVKLTTSLSFDNLYAVFGDSYKNSLEELRYNGNSRISFLGCQKLKKVSFGENVESITENAFSETPIIELAFAQDITIHAYAFKDCPFLTKVTGKNVVLYSQAFSGCTALTQVEFTGVVCRDVYGCAPFDGAAVTTARLSLDNATLDELFGSSVGKIESLYITKGEGYIKRNAAKDSGITEMTIEDGITAIGEHAFENCRNITQFVIPSSVTRVYAEAFASTPAVKVTAPSVFGCNDLFGSFSDTLVKEFVLTKTEGITSVGAYNFRNVASIERVILPDNITALSEGAFDGCKKLAAIEGMEKLTSLEKYSLRGTAISAYNADALTYLGREAFALTPITAFELYASTVTEYGALFGIDGLESLVMHTASIPLSSLVNAETLKYVTVAEGVTVIGAQAFMGMSNLLSIILPESLTAIGAHAFEGCGNITKAYISSNVTAIAERAFFGCVSLCEVRLPHKLTSLGAYAYAECERLESVDSRGGIKTMEEGVFKNCISLGSATFADGITEIKDYAFYNATKLTDFRLSATVRTIGNYAFWNNTVLNNVEFNGILSHIGDYAFYGCASFTEVVLSVGVRSIGSYSFGMCIKNQKTILPDSLTAVGEKAFWNNTLLDTLTLPSGIAFTNLFGTWEERPPLLTKVTYGKGNGVIAEDALANSLGITSVIVSEGIRTIGKRAFYNCQALVDIQLPTSVVSIGEQAFYRTPITSVNLKEGLTEIGAGAFEQCTELVSVSIPYGVSIIRDSAFYNCIKLQNVTIPSGSKLSVIENYAFMKCASLKSIALPSTLAVIGEWAFANCSSIDTVSFGAQSKINLINHYAFKGCSLLTSFTLPVNAEVLGWGVFMDCSSLSLFTVECGRNYLGYQSASAVVEGCFGRYIFAGTNINEQTLSFIGDSLGSVTEYEVFSRYFQREN